MAGGSGIRFPLDGLPPHLRAQAEAQLRGGRPVNRLPDIHAVRGNARRNGSASFRVLRSPDGDSEARPSDGTAKRPGTSAVVGTPAPRRSASRATPNRTEAAYNRDVLDGRGLYEPLVLRLPGGNYTPDWMTVDGATGRVTLHEVKGSYRFPSEGRALLAFRSAAAAFPVFRFVWVQRTKGGGWAVKRVLNDAPAPGGNEAGR